MKRFSMAMMGLALAGLMTMVSCRKPVLGFTNGDGRDVTIHATTESGNGSKTAIDGLNVNWSEGDKISMNGCVLTLKEGAGTTEGVFEGTVTGEGPYYVGYPKEYISYVADPLSFSINIPATMTYETARQIVPMVAVTSSVEGGLQFRNAVNMLKLRLKGNGTDASKLKSIVLTSTTSNLNGKINVTFDGETPTFNAIADGTKKLTVSFGGLQLTADATDVYIPLAKINGGDLTVRFSCANGKYMEKTIEVEDYASAFNGVNNVLDVETEVEVEGTTEPIGFTVNSDGKKVEFAPGNLYYNGADDSHKMNPNLKSGWNFYDHQYDYCTAATVGATNEISLFTWGYGSWSTDYTSHSYETGDKMTDWGEMVGDGWHTLSGAEWSYLLKERSGNRFAKARVNGINGMIIFPDNYAGTTSGDGITGTNSTVTTDFPTKKIPDATWTSMESAGVVFLPAAGYRNDNDVLAVTFKSDGRTVGYYWSATTSDANGKNATFISFAGNISIGANNTRAWHRSVRLVRDAE